MAVRNLTASHELTANLVARDLKVRYKGSVLGFCWSLLNPLLLVAVFTLVFKYVLRIEAPATPAGRASFPAFVLTGLLPWNYLVNCMSAGSVSITSAGGLIRKVHFPRETLPLSVVLAHGVSFLLELTVVFVFLGVSGLQFWTTLYLLPLLIVIFAVFALGLALFLAAVNVYFRDTQQLLAILTLVWFYATPIIYPLSLARKNLDGTLLTLYLANPATNFIRAFRAILYEGRFPQPKIAIYAPLSAIAMLALGWWTFRRLEPRFPEEV